MPYSILQVSKLASASMATTATEHNYRLQDTPNADPQLADANVEYLNHERRNYWHLASERIEELGLPRLRGDAVRAVELVLTASPDAFPREADHRAKDVRNSPWLRDNLTFVRQRFGEKNVLGFMLHQDEITPHIHCVVVPVTADGRLSCRDVFSPASLRQLQTDYAKAMAPHGLTRGIPYSTARHEDVRRYYGAQQLSRQELAELAQPVRQPAYRIRPRHESLSEVDYRDIEQMKLAKAWGELQAVSNAKITQLATIATANALARDQARVLERQLANSQELVVKTRADLTATTTQLQQAQQETTKQRTRAEEFILAHKQAVIRHSQGQPVPEYHVAQVQKLRAQHQRTIEDVLAKRLLLPIHEAADFKPDLAQAGAGYALKVLGPQEFIITSKRDGTRFTSSELRPNGRDLVRQLGEAVDRTQAQRTRELGRSTGLEM